MPEFTPIEFVSKWKQVTAREKQTYQEHFIDLCRLIHHPTPISDDPSGTRFAFEMGATKTSGGQGWADVAKIGYFGWEYKSKDADLDKAYEQLLRYRDSLQNPPLLIVSDINNIIIRTNYTNLPTRTITLTLDDFLKPDCIDTLRVAFTDPDEFKPQETVEKVTEEAAKQFSLLAENLRKYGYEPQEIAHFLIRLLFCLFAEDIGLLPEHLFPRLLKDTHRNSKDFSEVMRQLFRAMDNGGYFGSEKILHFNGGLFDDDKVLQLDNADMDILAAIDALDWSAIKPSIFGTLFERGLDPSKRSQLGAHYTSEADILLIVEPVLMQPLRRKWETIKEEVGKLKQEENKVGRGARRTTLQKNMREQLFKFANEIDSIKVLDPACGSGNFLYVALRLLLDLQKEVFDFADEIGLGRQFVTVTPSQLYGIEINEYAHELAQITIQIGYIQWLRDHGYGRPNEPILQPAKNIEHKDAILAYDENGKACEPEWPAVDVIVGNPPFLGGKRLRTGLGDVYVENLFTVYDRRMPREADLVCYWFEKARAMIEADRLQRAGLLATQGIRGGANRQVLERIKKTGDMFWAQADRAWILDGAMVHVSMVGFDDGREIIRELDGQAVRNINPDLSTAVDLTTAHNLVENHNICFMGITPAGPFVIPAELARQWLSVSGNPNGKSNSDVLKPYWNAKDITGGSRGVWIIDFAATRPIDEAAMYELPFEYIRRYAKPVREKNRRVAYRQKWWLHAEARPGMRQSIGKLDRYIATPRHSKYRLFVWIETPGLVDSATFVFALSSNYDLGVLHSRLHEAWARNTGTQVREAQSGFRYTPTSTFETFPFPWPPGKEPQDDPHVKAIAQAAKELVEQRDRWLHAEGLSEAEKKKRTLTNLYNQRPTWLDLAHKRLDEAVFAAYDWSPNLSDEEILEKLLRLNLERAGKQGN